MKTIKKKIIFVGIVLIIFMLLFLWDHSIKKWKKEYEKENINVLEKEKEKQKEKENENDILGYLEGKYNKSFVIKSKAKQSDISKEHEVADDDFVYGYNVYCKTNSDIVFTAGVIKRINVCPLLFPKKREEYFNDYEQKIKEYIVKKYQDDNYELYSYEDVQKLKEKVLKIMENVENGLQKYGFSTTKYSCSIKLNVHTNNGIEEVDFYMYDESIVQNILADLYLQNRKD